MQTLRELYHEIAKSNDRWSYYRNSSFRIEGKWDDNIAAFNFIKSYFDFAGKSQCFKDEHLVKNSQFIEARAVHIISTFLIGIKLFESFNIDIKTRDEKQLNLKYYWFLTCLYHDIGYAYESSSDFEYIRMLQSDGLKAAQEICDIKYIHNREFITYSKEIVDFYLKCRAIYHDGKPGVIDHGIVGGLLLYDKLRKQFAAAWNKRINKTYSRQSFFIKDECNNRVLHLSSDHYEAYAKAADAIITHNIWPSALNDYIDKYRPQNHFTKRFDKILFDNQLCFILSIADTIEPMKRNPKYIDEIKIDSLPNANGIELVVNKDIYDCIYKCIDKLDTWVDVIVAKSMVENNVMICISRR